MANGPSGAAQALKPGYIPAACRRAPNAVHDRAFGMWLCEQKDAGCPFHGPAYVLDDSGRRFECRKRDAVIAAARP